MHIVEYLSRCSSKAGDDPTAPLNSGPHNQNLLTFWSATSLPVSVLLIELDRFLAIRFPFKYPHLVNSPRSLALCSVTQLGSLITSVTLWGTKTMGNHNVFLAIIFIPYSICMAACLGCALYVVKTLIHQIRRDNRVSLSLERMELCVERRIVSCYKSPALLLFTEAYFLTISNGTSCCSTKSKRTGLQLFSFLGRYIPLI